MNPATMNRTPVAAGSIAILSHLRWIAAIVVVMSHIEQDILQKSSHALHKKPVYEGLVKEAIFAPHGYGHAAVVVFFVLSGFLVGGKLSALIKSENFDRDWRIFLVDRFVRIFIVLWPVLLITAITCAGLVWFVPDAPFVDAGYFTFDLTSPVTADLSASRWIGAATLLNEVLVPTLDTNGPLWSLAYEWLYYIVALAAVLAFRRHGSIIILYGALLVALSAFNQPDMLSSGLTWLAGWLARIVFDRRIFSSRASFTVCILAVVFVLLLDARHPTSDLVLGIALAFMVSHSIWTQLQWGKFWGDKLAEFSYSLYAVHFPLLIAIMGVLYAHGGPRFRFAFNAAGFAASAVVLILLVGFAKAFAFCTEDRTPAVKKWITRRWLEGQKYDEPIKALSEPSTE